MNRYISVALLVVIAIGSYLYMEKSAGKTVKTNRTELARVSVPDQLSDFALIGKKGFDTNCASCHGQNAAGQNGIAPPLIHKIYEPSHHGDESFQRAVAMGVRAHHWKFGNMPAIEGLTRADIKAITAYVRELQRHNGIN